MTDPAPAPAPPPADTTAAWHRQAACPQCGYSLQGHANPDCCPECGEVFAGLPGGLAWFTGERLRITAFAAMVLAVAVVVNVGLQADRGRAMDSVSSRMPELGFFLWVTNAATVGRVFPYVLAVAAALLWHTAPRPRTPLVWGALLVPFALPAVGLAQDLYVSESLTQQVLRQRQFQGAPTVGLPGDLTFAVLAAVREALLPASLALVLGLVAAHLSVVGLDPLGRRFGSWVRPALYALPAAVAAHSMLVYAMGPGAGGLGGALGVPSLEVATLVLSVGAAVGILGVSFALAVAALRLSLRARWTLEARR